MAKPGLARRALAEAFATFALVSAGCGAIIADAERDQALGTVGIGAVFGLVILAMVYATGSSVRSSVRSFCGSPGRERRQISGRPCRPSERDRRSSTRAQ